MKKRIFSLFLAALMLASAILATGAFAAGESTGYPDVPSTRWSAESIVYMTEKGMMNDTGSGKFEPTKSVNRAMVVTVLYRMAGSPTVSGKSTFSDVESGKWYTEAVIWGTKNSIVTGFSDSTFRPTDSVTREQLVTFIGRYAEKNYIATNGTELSAFADSGKIKDYALDYFKWAVKVGLVNGVTDTEIRPTEGATREQFAAIMHRYDTNESFDYRLKYSEPTLHSQYTEKDYPLRDDADFFVSTTGDDNNDGKTIATAFATFERARDAVREFKKTATEEIVVAFMAGEYGYLDNLQLTEEDSGTEAVPITYCAYGDGDVVFNNGISIKAEEFEPIEESDYYLFEEKNYDYIYKAYIGDRVDKIGQYDTLYSESQICWEARYPNKYPNGTDQYFLDMTTRVDQFKSIQLQMRAKSVADTFRTTEGMKVTGRLRFGWLIDTFLVESYDPETGILAFDFDNPDFYPWGLHAMEKWDLENQTGREYDQSRVDQYGEAGWGVLMYEERFDDYVIFHNLAQLLDDNGEYWIDTDTMTLYVYNPDGDYTLGNGGNFMSINSSYVSIVGFEFAGSAADYPFSLSATNFTFDLCKFRDMSSDVIIVGGGANTTVSNCEFEKFTRRALYISITNVYNNYFHNYGWPNPYYVAVTVTSGAVVSHNYFKDGAGGGIIFGGNPTIEYNVFDNLMAVNEDQGLVYTGTNASDRGAEIRYNLFKNVENGPRYSVYLDDMTCGVYVYGNIFYSGNESVVINGGRDNEIYDNVIIQSGSFSSSAKLYEYYVTDTIDTFAPGDRWYDLVMTVIPTEGDYRYNTWLEKWPWALNYTTDITKFGELECVFSNTNFFHGNHFIDCELGYDDPTDKFNICGVIEDNVEYESDENRLFVNPTIGDYRIREDADFPDLHFEMMGRE